MPVLGFQMVFQGRKNRFVHSYLRAIGFQNNMKKSDIEKLTDKIVSSPDRIEVSEDSMGNEFVEMTKEMHRELESVFAENMQKMESFILNTITRM